MTPLTADRDEAPGTGPRLRERIARLRTPSPREMDERLEELGYRGQREARRAACVLAYRHVRRLHRLYVDGMSSSELPGRENLLLVGPTGCGKTHLVELLFREILEVPTVIVDVTQFSETGYVGNDVSSILTRLVDAACGDVGWASCGVVCLDEFDKLAGSSSNARFAGQQTTKDVTGWGVQRSLLTLLGSEYAEYAPDHGFSGRTRPGLMRLAGVTFVACGAFSGLRRAQAAARPVGFGAVAAPDVARGAELEIADLDRYGFMPELLGRFTRMVEVSQLGEGELHAVLVEQVRRYRRELNADGLDLHVDPATTDGLVADALRHRVGARGLRATLTRLVEDVIYHAEDRGPLR
jgi:ATP-dependent Clp protease ATP-binding subunit ClpX